MAEGLETFTEEQKAAMIKELEAKLHSEFELKLNSVRTEEKNKLYPEIAKLKADLEKKTTQESELTKKIAELESKMKDLESKSPAEHEAKIKELNEQLEKANAKLGEGAEMSDKVLKELSEKLAKLEQRDIEREKELEKMKAEKEVSSYREEKLRTLDESVHELVVGTTKEQIDASAALAKSTFDKLTAKFGANINTPPKIPAAMLNNTDLMKSVAPGGISSMSDAEWAETRKKLGFK